MHCDLKSVPLLSEEIFLRNAAVCEDKLIGCRTADTHLILFCSEGKSGSSLFDNESRYLFHHTPPLFNLAGHREYNINIRFLSVCDEAFGSVKNPLISVQHRLCLLSLRIGTCAGLSKTESSELLTLCQRNYILLLLLLGTEGQNRIHAKRGVG